MRTGFALVVTLVLMILLAILVTGLLSISAIELRKGSQESSLQIARANARLGIMMAIGELQRELGPDKRITAPGGQQLPADSRSGRKNWVGVYDSWPGGSETRPSPVFRKWLVSGPASLTADVSSVASEGAYAATLVPGDKDNEPMTVPLVEAQAGAFGWWIADESMKASLGTTQIGEADEMAKANSARMSAPEANPSPFFEAEINPDSQSLHRLASTGTIPLLAPEDGSTSIHGMTHRSHGLVTDVRNGGFRRDLSIFLEQTMTTLRASRTPPAPYPSSPREPLFLYTAGSTNGISFAELGVDHQVWGEVVTAAQARTAGGMKHPDDSTIHPDTPVLLGKPTSSEFVNDPFFRYHHVTKLHTTLLLSLVSESRAITGGKTAYDLFLVVDPIYVIWNPFNVTLQLEAPAYTTFKTWNIPYDIHLTLQKGTAAETTTTYRFKDIAQGNFLNSELGKTRPVVLRPGEVQVYAQGFGAPMRGGSPRWAESYLGWEFQSGIKYRIPYETTDSARDGTHLLTYAMSPNQDRTTGSMDWGMLNDGHSIGVVDSSSSPNYHIGGFKVDYKQGRAVGDPTVIYASDHKNIFGEIARDPTARRTIAQLDIKTGDVLSRKWPIAAFSIGIRTEMDTAYQNSQEASTRFTGRPFLRHNPRSSIYTLDSSINTPRNLDPQLLRQSPVQIGFRRVNSLSDHIIDLDETGLGYFGGEYSAASGTSHFISHSISLVPNHSLGGLQHSVANGITVTRPNDAVMSFLQPSISHPISNSFAPSFMPPGATRGKIGDYDAADHSYLANLALWDSWFYSSLSPKTTTAQKNLSGARAEQKARLDAFLKGGNSPETSLPNRRFRIASEDPAASLARLVTSSGLAATADREIAASLFIDGAFNVNSTSLEAWEGVLMSLKKTAVPVRSVRSADTRLEKAGGTPVVGLSVPATGEIDPSGLSDPKSPDQWTGYRSLSDSEIKELANALVAQIRSRGPFLSLADFINRRPGDDPKTNLSGAIQSALDDPSVSINAPFRNSSRSLSESEAAAKGFENTKAEAGVKAVGIPGYVKQGDILTPLAPLISVRGDTFLIRSYGEARDKNGNVSARAWAEATVQRMPEYLDPTDLPHVSSPTLPVNQTFGRKLRIVSFRYMHPDELNR
jgi:hypothetical protein